MTVAERHPSADILKEIGETLSAERVAGGHSVADVSGGLRIIPAYIEAIEKGDMSALPAAPYAIGYVRTYARFLGIDADPLCERLRASLSEDEVRPEYTFVENKFARPRGGGRMAFAALTTLMVFYGGWYAFDAGLFATQDQPLPEPTAETILAEPPVGQPVAVLPSGGPGDDAPGTVNPQAAATTDLAAGTSTDQADQALDEGQVAAVQPQAVAQPPAEAEVADPRIEADEGERPASAGDPLAGPDPEPALLPGQALAHNRDVDTEMVIKAQATSWVEISRADGSIVSSWLMREGDEYIVPGDQDFYLTAGNAGGLEIEFSGGVAKKLGEWGETLSELPLDPSLLSERY